MAVCKLALLKCFRSRAHKDDNVNKHSYLVELHSSKKRETIHKKIAKRN